MHGVIPTEISKKENIGPGQYRHPDPFVPNIYLSTKKRFLIDAMTADVRTEIQLPGTENTGLCLSASVSASLSLIASLLHVSKYQRIC